jgi:hypothetical protein
LIFDWFLACVTQVFVTLNISAIFRGSILTGFYLNCSFLIRLIDAGFSQKSKHVASTKCDINLVVADGLPSTYQRDVIDKGVVTFDR